MAQPRDEPIPTRTTLIRRLKDWEDDVSWRDFFNTYWKLIHGVAIRSRLTETEAQDVVQETMLSVAKHMPNFTYDRSVGSFKAWLLNMTRWRITDQVRKRHHAQALLSDNAPPADVLNEIPAEENVDLEALWNDEWEKALLEAAVEKTKRHLDPQKYQIFDFYVNRGWSPDAVARTFGISTDQVYLIKHRVAEAIKEEVGQLKIKMA
jgi:RNA polymerase sigma-70 factor (ECF subfamily)